MSDVRRRAALALSLLFTVGASHAQTRSLEGVELHGLTRAAEDAEAPLPTGYWSLLVVRDGRRDSRELLARLGTLKAMPPGLAVLVLGERDSARRSLALEPALAALPWRVSEPKAFSLKLDLTGTPALLGIDPEGAIRWQRTGDPGDGFDRWLPLMSRWNAQRDSTSAPEPSK